METLDVRVPYILSEAERQQPLAQKYLTAARYLATAGLRQGQKGHAASGSN